MAANASFSIQHALAIYQDCQATPAHRAALVTAKMPLWKIRPTYGLERSPVLFAKARPKLVRRRWQFTLPLPFPLPLGPLSRHNRTWPGDRGPSHRQQSSMFKKFEVPNGHLFTCYRIPPL
jgi:hypothetical protein